MTQMLDPHLFLPEPEPATLKYTVISVDDHLVEPRDMFEGRLPAKLQARAPKIMVNDDGHEVWEFEGEAHYQAGMNAVVRLIGGGYTNRQIAAELVITVGTAGVHIEHILRKLDLRSRHQVADWARARGLGSD